METVTVAEIRNRRSFDASKREREINGKIMETDTIDQGGDKKKF
jgi:hypothetical protein